MTAEQAVTAWSWRHAVARSGLPPETRHVLLTLSLKMDETGGSCYPPVSELVDLTGRDKKTVLKHLALAEERGWIAISQHGYKGQRWKRNEYVACWPGRDLTGHSPAENGEKGGGAVPPPCEGEVVETVPEGGGTGSRKVVEQLHQDKTLPETLPDNSPERAPARAAREGEIEDPKRIEAAYWRIVRVWPQLSGLPKDTGLKAFMALSPQDREIAERRFPHWLALLKAQGKDHVHAPSTYFGKRLFDDVAEPDERPAVLEAKPFGPLWTGAVVRELLTPPVPPPAPASAFMAQMIARDDAAGQAERLRRQAEFGWPRVKGWYAQAESRRGFTLPAGDAWLKDRMEAVPVGSAAFEAWRAEFERRGWPWLPDHGAMPVVYFPAGGPEGIGAFEAAVKASENGQSPQARPGVGPDGPAVRSERSDSEAHVGREAAE